MNKAVEKVTNEVREIEERLHVLLVAQEKHLPLGTPETEGVRVALCECVRYLLEGNLQEARWRLRNATYGLQQLGIEV